MFVYEFILQTILHITIIKNNMQNKYKKTQHIYINIYINDRRNKMFFANLD
jgi:hypothetical protein